MNSPRKSAATVSAEYNKEELITSLKEVRTRYEAAMKSHEEEMEEWRKNTPDILREAINNYMERDAYGYRHSFHFNADPPREKAVCRDIRIQNVDREIARIGLVSGDTVRLRFDDPIFGWIAAGKCED